MLRQRLSRFWILVFLGVVGTSVSGCKDLLPLTGATKKTKAKVCTEILKDTYSSFLSLQENEIEGQIFRRWFKKRESPFLVTAIHGGLLEEGTDVLAQALASNKHSYYVFEALVRDEPRTHVTSHKFDDPVLLQLAENSQNCVSFHGFYIDLQAEVCIGGLNAPMQTAVAQAIQSFDPSLRILSPCKKFAGAHLKNIVNRCKNSGIQLELSELFRQKLLQDPVYLSGFVGTLRQALAM